MPLSFSGDDTEAPVAESLAIHGSTTRPLVLEVVAYADTVGTVTYSYALLDPCPESLAGCSPCWEYTGCDESHEERSKDDTSHKSRRVHNLQ